MAITFFGVATVPADNSAQAGPTVTITPPASMVDGDLVYVSVRYRASSATITVSDAGGQSWTQVGSQYNTTNIRAAIFWCRFNGTWSSNPAFTVTSGTNNMDAQMLVFRPTSAAYTWTLESGPNSATYSAPSTPFTVTVTGRDTTAPSTVSIAAWHSIDDNSWGSLSGTGWSKTSLGAQYRNNSTSDNSSSFSYNIQTSPATLANVSQNQSALGGDAGSTSLVTFAETLVSVALTGLAATAAAGSLGVSQTFAGIAGVESATAVGDAAAIVPGGGTNATGSPTGVAGTAAAGTLGVMLSPVAEPTGVGVGTAVGALVESITTTSGVGVSATAQVGAMAALGGAPGLVDIGGVSATPQVGVLTTSHPVLGLEGLVATGQVGSLTATGGGVVNATGQPPSRFATAEAGSIAVSPGQPIAGVSATATADDLLAASMAAEIDGTSATVSVGALTEMIGTTIEAVSAVASVGSPAPIGTAVVAAVGAQSVVTVGNLAGITSGAGVGVPEGVSAAALAGSPQAEWTFTVEPAGVSAAASVGDVAVEAGDSVSDEAFPSGVQAACAVGVLSTGEALAAAQGVQASAQAGSVTVAAQSERIDPTRRKKVSQPNRTSRVQSKKRRT